LDEIFEDEEDQDQKHASNNAEGNGWGIVVAGTENIFIEIWIRIITFSVVAEKATAVLDDFSGHEERWFEIIFLVNFYDSRKNKSK